MATRTQEAFHGWLSAIDALMVKGHYDVARKQLDQLRMKAWDSNLSEGFWEEVHRKSVMAQRNPAKKTTRRKAKKNPTSVRSLVSKALK